MNQCEGKVKSGRRCERTVSVQTDAKWLCKQHGGKRITPVLPSCTTCDKPIRTLRHGWLGQTNDICNECYEADSIQFVVNHLVGNFAAQEARVSDENPRNVGRVVVVVGQEGQESQEGQQSQQGQDQDPT